MSLPVDKYPLYFLYYLETIHTYLYSKPVGAWYKGAIEIIIVVTTHTITCTRYQHYNSGREHVLDKTLTFHVVNDTYFRKFLSKFNIWQTK